MPLQLSPSYSSRWPTKAQLQARDAFIAELGRTRDAFVTLFDQYQGAAAAAATIKLPAAPTALEKMDYKDKSDSRESSEPLIFKQDSLAAAPAAVASTKKAPAAAAPAAAPRKRASTRRVTVAAPATRATSTTTTKTPAVARRTSTRAVVVRTPAKTRNSTILSRLNETPTIDLFEDDDDERGDDDDDMINNNDSSISQSGIEGARRVRSKTPLGEEGNSTRLSLTPVTRKRARPAASRAEEPDNSGSGPSTPLQQQASREIKAKEQPVSPKRRRTRSSLADSAEPAELPAEASEKPGRRTRRQSREHEKQQGTSEQPAATTTGPAEANSNLASRSSLKPVPENKQVENHSDDDDDDDDDEIISRRSLPRLKNGWHWPLPFFFFFFCRWCEAVTSYATDPPR